MFGVSAGVVAVSSIYDGLMPNVVARERFAVEAAKDVRVSNIYKLGRAVLLILTGKVV
jgi:hypothetical protein